MGTSRTPERERPRISVLEFDGSSVGRESISATQVEGTSSFARNQRSRIPRFQRPPLSSLRVPLKVIQERLGHASAGSLTLDVYTHSEWEENLEAAQLAGEKIEKAVNSVSLTAVEEKGPADENQQALVST
jgi:hypothetical protein